MLGPEAEKYTPAQLEELRKQMYAVTDLLLDIYLNPRPERDVDSVPSGDTIKAERSKNKSSFG